MHESHWQLQRVAYIDYAAWLIAFSVQTNAAGKDKLRQDVETSKQGHYFLTAEVKKQAQLLGNTFINKGSDRQFLNLQIKFPVCF